MPTYEYECDKCGHQFEVIQPITDKPLVKCPADACVQKRWGKGRVKRRIGAGAGLLFKGSGFYITDYRSEGYKEAAKKDTAPSAGTSSDSAKVDSAKPTPAKAESKPAKPVKPAKTDS